MGMIQIHRERDTCNEMTADRCAIDPAHTKRINNGDYLLRLCAPREQDRVPPLTYLSREGVVLELQTSEY